MIVASLELVLRLRKHFRFLFSFFYSQAFQIFICLLLFSNISDFYFPFFILSSLSQRCGDALEPKGPSPTREPTDPHSFLFPPQDESDMETEPTTPTGTAQGSGASATSPSGAASVSPSSSTTSPPEGGALERRKGRTGWPETVWAQELKH